MDNFTKQKKTTKIEYNAHSTHCTQQKHTNTHIHIHHRHIKKKKPDKEFRWSKVNGGSII